MVRRPANPIREGLSSKVYLCAYPEYKTGYKIAEELDVSANKVYHDVLKKHSKLFDRKEGRPAPVRSSAEPLVKEISKEVKEKIGEELTQHEKTTLLKILDSEEFRSSIIGSVLKSINLRKEGNIDSAGQIMRGMSVLSAICVFKNEISSPTLRKTFKNPAIKRLEKAIINGMALKNVPEELVILLLTKTKTTPNLMPKVLGIDPMGELAANMINCFMILFEWVAQEVKTGKGGFRR